MVMCFSFFSTKKGRSSNGTRIVEVEEEVSSIQNVIVYTYKQLRAASDNFSNKIGEGGFGSVYKGKLRDGTEVAIKELSADSMQGVREFLTEIKTMSDLEHENLVKLHGCCAEGNHRILVYEYLENNSLSQTLLGSGHCNIHFNWRVRTNICIGVARGLAFLHEEVRPHIIHRDVKASNILLDKDLSPKISDFGLAKLILPNQTHVTTRVAGTTGYLAPEYILRNQLTRKADIYSYGVLLLEIVSGRSNRNKWLPEEERYLLERAWALHEQGKLLSLVDESLEANFDTDEALRFMKISLLCTQVVPKLRPSMSTVVKMLEGSVQVDDHNLSKPGLIAEFMSMRSGESQTSNSNTRRNSNQQSAGSSKTQLSDPSTDDTITMSGGTMTFNSIYNRD